jgi:hypothetical protein
LIKGITKVMLKLEDIKKDAQIRGLEGNKIVRIVHAEPIGSEVVGYFKEMAEGTGVPYQSLINLYLRDCVRQHRTIDISWQSNSKTVSNQ